MKIFTADKIKHLDQQTIEKEPIPSIDLMERAARTFAEWFADQFSEDSPVYIFCGPGNNGGDGLAVARMLHQRFFEVTVFLCRIGKGTSPDFDANLERLPPFEGIEVKEIKKKDSLPDVPPHALIIDAIFGSGLNRPVEGYWASLIETLNQSGATLVSIDIPSGLFADNPTTATSVRPDWTFSFEMPKLSFLFPENQDRVGQWVVHSIGLYPPAIEETETPYYYVDHNFAASLLKTRGKYDHKGHYGHSLLVMGSLGKIGAVVLASRACLRSGTGLLTVHIPKCGYQILQTAVPEAMVMWDRNEYCFSSSVDVAPYKAIGIGCGIGTDPMTVEALSALLEQVQSPVVLDADALNIISKNPEFFEKIPKGSILTPHPKEFERLFGKTANDFERNELQRRKAKELSLTIVLKGANTCTATPDGKCHFNSTGNPGMATGGSGDVLTGVITGLLAQGYTPEEAATLGVYLHGLAGDIAVEEGFGQEALIASDLVDYLGDAFTELKN